MKNNEALCILSCPVRLIKRIIGYFFVHFNYAGRMGSVFLANIGKGMVIVFWLIAVIWVVI